MKILNLNTHFILLLLIIQTFSTCQKDEENDQITGSLQPISEGQIIEHQYYSLAYSEAYEGALWVFYHLTPEHINGPGIRKDNFKIDPLVSTGSAALADYVGSGYDRGHLAPAASMKINQNAMDESFYMSNMSPQHPSCNRGRWKSLETKVREWVIPEGELYVVSGPIFKDNIETIGENAVTVPGYYYKITYNNKDKMIGFILPNESCPDDLINYVVTVDSIEGLTGIDFFSIISDDAEKIMESTTNSNVWGL